MSTKLSTIHAALIAKIEATIPALIEKRLPDPYTLETNPAILLNRGYAVKIAEGLNTERELSCNAWISRTFSIVMTRIVEALKTDTERKSDQALELAEDMMAFRLAVEKDSTLDGNAASFKYVSDTGIQLSLFEEGDKHFYTIEALVSIEYSESYTAG